MYNQILLSSCGLLPDEESFAPLFRATAVIADVSVENTEMELVEECQFVQFHLQEEEVEREERDISEANQHISYDHSKRGVPFAIYFSKWCF